MTAMLRGEISVFEGSAWVTMPAPVPAAATWPNYGTALEVTSQTYIKLSRLVYLTRKAELSPGDEGCQVEAVDLAAALFDNDLGWWVEQLQTSQAVQLVPSVHAEPGSQLTYSFNFESSRLYHILAKYWAGRVVLCGCIQRLGTLPPTTRTFSSLNFSAAQEKDVENAHNVAMCFGYISQLEDPIPFAYMWQRLMLRTVFGAWHRLEEREMGMGLHSHITSGAGTASPTDMKAWCLSTLNNLETQMSHQLSTEDELVRMATCLSGGAICEPAPVGISTHYF